MMKKKCMGTIFLIFLTITYSSIAGEFNSFEVENIVLNTLNAEYNILKTGTINQRNIVPSIQSVRLNEGYEYLDELVERHKRITKSGLSISDLSIKILSISTEKLNSRYSSNVKVDVSYKLSSFEDEKLEVVTEEIKNYEFVFNKINSESFLLEKYTIVEAFEATNPLLYQDEDLDFPADVSDEPLDFNRMLDQKYPEEDTEKAYYGYNRINAKNYALKWAKGYNSAYRKHSKDCTNFASQCVKAGGWTDKSGWYKSKNSWWYGKTNQTWTWVNAHYFYDFHRNTNRSITAQIDSKSLNLGDIVFADWNSDNKMDHSMIVTQKLGNKIFLSYHSNPAKNKYFGDLPVNATYYGRKIVSSGY